MTMARDCMHGESTLRRVISSRELSRTRASVVAFDIEGLLLGSTSVGDKAETSLVAGPVSDAIKIVGDGGLVVGGRNREDLLQLEGFIVATAVLAELDDELSAEGLIEAVEKLGYEWSVRSSFDL